MKPSSLFPIAVLLSLLASCGRQAADASRPARPESPLAHALGLSQADVDRRIDSLWLHFFTPGDLACYADDGERSVYYEVGDSMAFVLDTGSDDVRTEGMSYGMMIAVQLGHRETFDRLWRWAKRYMAYPADSPWSGYFCWQCLPDGTQVGESNASDGEIYFATALLRASDVWGEPAYAAEARRLLRLVQTKDPASGVHPLFDPAARLVTFCPTPEVHWFSDPSYCLPAFLDYWAARADTLGAFWAAAADSARLLLARSCHPSTGLFPDYSLFDGTPYAWPRCGYNSARYQYDALRCAMNVGMDCYLSPSARVEGYDPAAMMARLLAFCDADGYRHGHFDTDGSHPDGDYSAGMAGANAVGAIALLDSPDPALRALARRQMARLWATPAPTGKFRYYSGMVYMLAMLHVSGHFSLAQP